MDISITINHLCKINKYLDRTLIGNEMIEQEIIASNLISRKSIEKKFDRLIR